MAKLLDAIVLYALNLPANFLVAAAFFGVTYQVFSRNHLPGATPQHALFFVLVMLPFQTLIALAYYCFFVRKYDATLGKIACGLRLFRPDGSKLSMGRIIGRHFAEYISSITLCIGYLMVAWDEEKRALHDRICDTRVVHAK